MSTAQSTPQAEQSEPEKSKPQTNWTVVTGVSIVVIAVTIWALLATQGWSGLTPADAQEGLGTLVGWVTDWFGWYYVLLATAVLVFVIYIALSRYGTTKLGPNHSKPEFGNFSWASMLFAAGIGTDLMFFAVAEPVTQYLQPPDAKPESVVAAREATVWTLFHYGITGWGMYALMGIALGYFAYRLGLPLAVRSVLAPLIGRKSDGLIGDGIDLAAMLGTIFGVATTLGIAVGQLNFGLTMMFGVPNGLAIQIVLIVVGVAMATLSAVSGVDRGIKWLSQANVILALFLAAWILITGRTTFLLNALVLNVGDFVGRFPDMAMQTFAFEDKQEWMALWTLFFWAWWIAWAAFVGLFLARISRGRTIRQFVAGTLIIPFLYILMWISIYGNAAIDLIRQGNTEFGEKTVERPEVGFFTLLQEYSGSGFEFIAAIAIFVGMLFYVTSADSGALVMANLSSRLQDVRDDAGSGLRIYWAMLTGVLTISLLAVDGVYTLQFATVIMGIPFAIVMTLVMFSLMKALRTESHLADARTGVFHRLLSGRSPQDRHNRGQWQARLRRSLTYPNRQKAEEYLDNTVAPALRDVAAELGDAGVEATVNNGASGEDRYVELIAGADQERPFSYRVQRQSAAIPLYGAVSVPSQGDYYSRLEVYLPEGSPGYDVMGYSHAQIIDDVLDTYEYHLEFLRLQEADSQ